MSSIEKRLRDELGELASWLIDKRAESSPVEQADSGSDSIPRDSGSDSIPRLDLDADTVRSGGRSRLFRIAAVLVLIVGLVGVSGLLSEDAPSVVTVPADPATQTPTTSAPTTSAPTTSVPTTTTVDDLSTDDAGDESSIVDLAPEVDPEVPPRGPLDESSTQAEEWLIGPFGGYAYGDQQVAPSLFPWGDGFLQIGYLNTSEQVPTEINLFAQTSDDGLNWEQPFQVNLPREHFEALETDIDSPVIRSWPIIRSNGEHLVVLSQLPGRHFGDEGANAVLGRQSAPASAHIEQRVFVSVTDDLEGWNHYEYPLLPPDGIHESLGTSVVAEDVVVSDEGWIIQISTLTYMDIGLLVPDSIRESAKEIRWIDYEDGTWVSTSDGLLIEWIIEDTISGSTESHRKFFSWEELGTTSDLFQEYGALHTKPYHFSYRYSGSVLVGRWGEEPIRRDLPSVSGFCCDIIATDAGYIGLSDAVEPGYAPGQFGWGALIFSPDGLTWQLIESPAGEVFQDSQFQDSQFCAIWTPSVHAVEGGVVMYSLESWISDCGCGTDRFQTQLVWVGDAKGLNWELQNISDNPCHERYSIAKSVGRGILLHIYVPLDYSEEPDTWDDRYQSTIVSTDGINWFTFYEETDPDWWSSVAFNGNVAVRVDSVGNAYRYELQ